MNKKNYFNYLRNSLVSPVLIVSSSLILIIKGNLFVISPVAKHLPKGKDCEIASNVSASKPVAGEISDISFLSINLNKNVLSDCLIIISSNDSGLFVK